MLRRKTFRRARRADENPARLCGNPKGRCRRGLGNPHGWILGERKRGFRRKNQVSASEVPPQIRFEGASAFGSYSLTRFRYNTTTNARTAGECCAITAAKAKALAMMAAASNRRCKRSVRLQRSPAMVAAFMFLPNCRRGIVSFSQHPFAIEDDVTVCQVRVRRMCNFYIKRGRVRGRVMVRWDRQYIMCAGAAIVAALLSVSKCPRRARRHAAELFCRGDFRQDPS